MAKSIRTSIDIKASVDKVWTILTEFDKYNKWNPFILTVIGIPEVGNILRMGILPPNSKGIIYKAKVITRVEKKEFSWLSKLPISGIGMGKHTYELKENENGVTTFVHKEDIKCMFVPFYNFSNIIQGFNLMNEKLKEIAENRYY